MSHRLSIKNYTINGVPVVVSVYKSGTHFIFGNPYSLEQYYAATVASGDTLEEALDGFLRYTHLAIPDLLRGDRLIKGPLVKAAIRLTTCAALKITPDEDEA